MADGNMATVKGKSGKESLSLPAFLNVNKYMLPPLPQIENFLKKNPGIEIDEVNQRGETALMMACQKGNKDTVKFLLEKGANPNSSAKNGYTPLHFAASYERHYYYTSSGSDDEDEHSTDVNRLVAKAKKREVKEDEKTLEVFRLLHDDFSAVIQQDNNGLNPIDIAALNRKKCTVAYCLNNHWISEAEQIRALEIIGMAFAIGYNYSSAYRALSKAKKRRSVCGLAAEDHKSVLERCFGRGESKTLDDLEKLKTSANMKEEIVAEGFLVGDRVLPDQLKSGCLYNHLAQDAQNSMGQIKTWPKVFVRFSECLLLEKRGLISFGSVLNVCKDEIDTCLETHQRARKSRLLLSHVRGILNAYIDVAREVGCSELKEHVETFVSSLASILFNITHHCFSTKIVDEFMAPIATLLTVIWSRIPTFQVINDELYRSEFDVCSVSVCHMVLGTFVRRLCCNFPFGSSEHERKRFKRLFAQLLQIEGAAVVCCCGSTMLHSIMKILPMDFDLVMDLTNLLLRHGCPREVKNMEGKTPADVAAENLADLSELEKLCGLLEGHTRVYPLEELAARAVLHHRIPYSAVLPDSMRDVVQDGILLEDESGFETPSDYEYD